MLFQRAIIVACMVMVPTSSAPMDEEDDMVVKKLHISGPQNDVAEIILGSGGDAFRYAL